MVADPIEAISAVSKSSGAKSAAPIVAKKSESDFLYHVNYVIAVMSLTQVCMKHQQELVSVRSKLAEITTKIQADLNILNQTMSTFENQAAPSRGLAQSNNEEMCDAFNGFGPSGNKYFSYDTNGNINGTPDPGLVSTTSSEMNAFFDLFFCTPSTSSDVTLHDLMTMDNPVDATNSFNMQKFWTGIADGYNIKSDFSYYTIGTADIKNYRPSLIQQYVYWQAKLNLMQASPEDIKAAGNDFTKIPGMNFDPRNTDFDANLANIWKVIGAMNTTVSPRNDAQSWVGGDNYVDDLIYAKTSGSNNSLYFHDSFLAYNYFWTKDPQAKNSDGSDSTAQTDANNNGTWVFKRSNHGTDVLSSIYGATNTAQATLSSSASSQGTNFQQDTSGMTTENNEVQQMISSFMQGQGSVVGNFKGA